jgi:hypothetical protein
MWDLRWTICIGSGFSPITSFALANYFTNVSHIIILIIRAWYNRFNLGQSATDSLTLTLSCPCVLRQAVLTSHYVLPHNLDVVVTVWTCVLMPEANHMPQLMHYDPKLVTVLSNRNSLRTVATLSNKWTAPAADSNNAVRGTYLNYCNLHFWNSFEHVDFEVMIKLVLERYSVQVLASLPASSTECFCGLTHTLQIKAACELDLCGSEYGLVARSFEHWMNLWVI